MNAPALDNIKRGWCLAAHRHKRVSQGLPQLWLGSWWHSASSPTSPTPAPLLVGCPAGCSRPRCCTRSQSTAQSPQHCKPGPEQRCACKLTSCRPVALSPAQTPCLPCLTASRLPLPARLLENDARQPPSQPIARPHSTGGLESLGYRFRHCLLSPPPRHVSGAQASVSTGQPAVCGSAELSTSATFVFCCPCLQP